MTISGGPAKSLSKMGLRAHVPPGMRCQICLEYGHWTFQCIAPRKYAYRSSRSELLERAMTEKAKKLKALKETLARKTQQVIAKQKAEKSVKSSRSSLKAKSSSKSRKRRDSSSSSSSSDSSTSSSSSSSSSDSSSSSEDSN